MRLSLNPPPQALLNWIEAQSAPKRESHTNRVPVSYPVSLEKDVHAMLAVLDPDMGYDDWVKVGMALHNGGYDVGVWESWSAQGTKYKIRECKNKWGSFDGSGNVTMGTLVHLARAAGYAYQGMPLSMKNNALPLSPIPKNPIKIYHWSELDTLPKRQYLIKGWLEQGGMSVVYGASNSGKTFIALDMACHIALGWDWRDHRVKQGSVVYIAGEGGLGIHERLTAFQRHHQHENHPNVYVAPSSVPLCKGDSLHTDFLGCLKDIPDIQLIVVDTLARSMGAGDENSASDMGSFIQNCDSIRQHTKAHVMVIHHSGKEEIRGARGHSSLKAAVDTEIRVTQNDGLITASIMKQRDGKTGLELHFSLKEYEVARDEDNGAVNSCVLIDSHTGKPSNPLSTQAKKAHELLIDLLLDKGKTLIPRSGMKSQNVVQIQDFEAHCQRAHLCKSDNPDSFKRAFARVRETLQTKGYTTEWGDYIWRTDKPDKSGQTE
jgi:hypothetical protein